MTKKNDNAENKWQKFAEEESKKQQQAIVEEEKVEVPVETVDTVDSVSSVDAVDLIDADTAEMLSEMVSEVTTEQDDSQLIAFELEIKKYKDLALRAEADMENIKRRAERDVSNAHKYANEKLLKELLPVVDSLNRGLEGIDATDEHLVSMITGLEMTKELLEKALGRFGVVIISPEKGEAFDPELHEAMSVQADPEAEHNTILQVLEKGYQLNGRVLRAAMVIVAS